MLQTILKRNVSGQTLNLGAVPKSEMALQQGKHGINPTEVFDYQNSLTPTDPGSFERFRFSKGMDRALKQGNVAIKPQHLSKLKVAAKMSRDVANATEQGASYVKQIKRSEARINRASFGMKKVAATADLESSRGAVDYANHMHELRPKYAKLGQSLANTADTARSEVALITEGLIACD